MDRIIIAFEGEKQLNLISEALEHGGVPVGTKCRSGAEVLRMIKKMGGGIVITGYKLTDMTVDDLAFELNGTALILSIAAPTQLEFCENGDVLKLPLPVSRADLLASVRILRQMEDKYLRMNVARRTPEEEKLIEQTKARLMRAEHLTEAQAHQLLQRLSMNTGMKMVDAARDISQKLDSKD